MYGFVLGEEADVQAQNYLTALHFIQKNVQLSLL